MSNASIMTYHEEGRDDPIHYDREPNLYPQPLLLEGQMERFVPDLAQDGIHHDKQTDGFRQKILALVF